MPVARTPLPSIKHHGPAIGADADVEAAIRVHEWTHDKLRELMKATGHFDAHVLRRNIATRLTGCGEKSSSLAEVIDNGAS